MRIALNPQIEAIREMLVHEASHQIYNLTIAPTDVCRPDAPAVYSVLKRTFRPLERVVFALHATANIAAFYATSPTGGGWARDRALADHAALSDACRTAAASLTRTGRAIVETLTCPLPPTPSRPAR